ncbi:hypothetical protein OKW45_003390 [Paraburkholderia sp. WSM4175]
MLWGTACDRNTPARTANNPCRRDRGSSQRRFSRGQRAIRDAGRLTATGRFGAFAICPDWPPLAVLLSGWTDGQTSANCANGHWPFRDEPGSRPSTYAVRRSCQKRPRKSSRVVEQFASIYQTHHENSNREDGHKSTIRRRKTQRYRHASANPSAILQMLRPARFRSAPKPAVGTAPLLRKVAQGPHNSAYARERLRFTARCLCLRATRWAGYARHLFPSDLRLLGVRRCHGNFARHDSRGISGLNAGQSVSAVWSDLDQSFQAR